MQESATGGGGTVNIERVREYLREQGYLDRLHEFEQSTATVELAAEALGTDPDQIAKTLSFYGKTGGAILIVAAGKRRIDNHKFKEQFGLKAKMLTPEDTERLTGNAAGGVCPFLVPQEAEVWLDISLRDHEIVYPAAGSPHSGVKLTCDELEKLARPSGWCDVCKEPAQAPD